MADAFFSAGATGAITAAATAYVTPFKYESEGTRRPIRPCLTSALPNRQGGLTVLCDMGANPDVEVEDLVVCSDGCYVCESRLRHFKSSCRPFVQRLRGHQGIAFHQRVFLAHGQERAGLCG